MMRILRQTWIIVLLLAQDACSFLSHSRTARSSRNVNGHIAFRTFPSAPSRNPFRLANSKKKDDEGDDGLGPGMSDAFRQLDSLKSLGDDAGSSKASPPPSNPISADKASIATTEGANLSPEKEAQMYSDMMKDLETTDDEKIYSDLLTEMGGSAKTSQSSPPPSSSILDSTSTAETSTTATPTPSQEDMEKFMDQALNEALDEVKLKSPDSLSAESILNDKEIMKEIEAIFDRGSEQLMEELEEIRKEQTVFAEKSAASSAQDAAEAVSDEAKRLAKAEASMSAMLDKVNQEAAQVEKAAQDLRQAQEELDKDFIVKLRSGGLPKQMALVGFLLFSVRSILDTVAAFNDESLLAGALLQGGVALVCAAIFFFL